MPSRPVEKGVLPVDWPRELALVGKMFSVWHIVRTYKYRSRLGKRYC